ncbi:bacterial transferase hexapeptide repeat protein [Acetobacteraceae bacterium AT-5844]|nr:bacterial transferase hexapeptide repeat protein [Acetobacteraceae bacterium AT-5844]
MRNYGSAENGTTMPDSTSTIAKTANITSKVTVEPPLHMGPGSEFHSGSVGRYCFINAGTIIYNDVHIGRFSTFARRCQIGGAEHPLHHLTTSFFRISRNWFPNDPLAQTAELIPNSRPPGRERGQKILIGNDVWIGAEVVILKGVSIGDGAVIGAGAVVTRDIPPYAVVAGNPARVLRYRFDQQTISELMELKWWELPPEQIAELPLNDVERCIALLRDIRARDRG